MDEYFEFFRKIPLFDALSDGDVSMIQSACREMRFSARDVIFRQGEPGDELYIVYDGSVEIWVNYEHSEADLLSVYGTGQLFGELALIDEAPRSATVVARQPSVLMAIRRTDFDRITQSSPISKSIMRSLTHMIRRRTETFIQGMKIRNRKLENSYERLKSSENRHQRIVQGRDSDIRVFHDHVREAVRICRRLTDRPGDTLSDHQSRLEILAICHECLSRNSPPIWVDAIRCLKKMLHHLAVSERSPQKDFPVIEVMGKPFFISHPECVRIGFILTELFPVDGRMRRVAAQIGQAGGQMIELSIALDDPSTEEGSVFCPIRTTKARTFIEQDLGGFLLRDPGGKKGLIVRIPRSPEMTGQLL